MSCSSSAHTGTISHWSHILNDGVNGYIKQQNLNASKRNTWKQTGLSCYNSVVINALQWCKVLRPVSRKMWTQRQGATFRVTRAKCRRITSTTVWRSSLMWVPVAFRHHMEFQRHTILHWIIKRQRNLVGNTVTCTSIRNVNIFTQSLSFREHKVSKTPICCDDFVRRCFFFQEPHNVKC